ncbi:ArsR family transcriptional regulator [Fulvivirga lutea]|uniref:ArsR family transcriptional regulator n=1 Tax=Fulvivirga lutea TaxID=2810512 RepID=A0A975A0U1_9BACT|nr:ArsR family transcriptional regulator [Fulvivirga lutea]QSE96822.1 ArsR family transcriptional regulator [Fulvivirga lutea]
MLDTLVTSKTRIKLLLKFFLNTNNQAYLRNLEVEFGVSTNAIRVELNKFEEAGLLCSKFIGNKKVFSANTDHAFFNDIHEIVLKYIGIDKLIENVLRKIGDLKKVYLIGDYTNGNDGGDIEFLLVGNNLDSSYVSKLFTKAQNEVSFKLRYKLMNEHELEEVRKFDSGLLIWGQK